MKITWVSPFGDGWSIGKLLRDAGNKVVYYNPSGNKNGAGYLPEVTDASWFDFAAKSDVVIVDNNPESRKTRRSWSPSDLTMDLQRLRHRGVPVIGPVPTSELLGNDLRYRRKILGRLGFADKLDETGRPAISLTLTRDPDGRCFLVFRHRQLLGPTNGPDLGNLGDVVVAIPDEQPLIQRTARQFDGLLDRIAFRGYLNLDLTLTDPDVYIRGINSGFLYPAIFCQMGNLLRTDRKHEGIGIATTVLDFDADQSDSGAGNQRTTEGLLEHPGFFGAELHRDFDTGKAVGHGLFVGACVGIGQSWPVVEQQIEHNLAKLNRLGFSFRPGIGDGVLGSLQTLTSWGYLS